MRLLLPCPVPRIDPGSGVASRGYRAPRLTFDLIATGRGDRASIQEITNAADIGFGSFYNQFHSKDEQFATASAEVLERRGQMINRAYAGVCDPAGIVAASFRISGRLGWTQPGMARFITGSGLSLLDARTGVAPRALRDIQAGHCRPLRRGHPAAARSPGR